MKRSLELVSQLIVIAEEKDRAWRELHRKLNKSSQSIGEDSITFHLRRLKELLEEEEEEKKVIKNRNDNEVFYSQTGQVKFDTSPRKYCISG